MIAEDQTLLPVQPLQDRLRLLAAEEHISHDADGISVLHSAVPVLYDHLVHFLYRFKRTVAELQHVPMAEVRIGYKVEHVSTSFFYVPGIVYIICLSLTNVRFGFPCVFRIFGV